MQKLSTGKFIGCTMILVGTVVGAGMLALPMVSVKAGFFWSTILMFIFWISSTLAGLLVIETNLAFPNHSCSFSTMAEKTLGNSGKIVTWISKLFLLYAIITAYIIGETDLLINTFSSSFQIDISAWIISAVFTFGLGIAVFFSTKAVDYLNRSFLSVKGFLLLATLILLTPHVDIVKLISSQDMLQTQAKYMLLPIPIFLCAFGYHFVIPSLRMYIGERPRELRNIVIAGGTIALIIYLWWLAVVLGTVEVASLAKIPSSSIGKFTQLMISTIQSKWVAHSINSFTNIAMTTSFLGVSLSLFDFLADGFKRSNSRFGRLQTAILTFVPPLLFALLYPQGFVIALNYASIAMAIITFILPPLMTYKLRKNKNLKSSYRTKCGNTTIFSIVFIGFVSITLALMYNFGFLACLQ